MSRAKHSLACVAVFLLLSISEFETLEVRDGELAPAESKSTENAASPPSNHNNNNNSDQKQASTGECREDSNSLIDTTALATFNLYDNHKQGSLRDHYYTSVQLNDTGYAFEVLCYKPLGKVLTTKTMSSCDCVGARIAQFYADSKKPVHRDHMLLPVWHDEELVPRQLLSYPPVYRPTGEIFYCARKKGACGASLPLRSFFRPKDKDWIGTVGSEPRPPLAIPSRANNTLCYIWPVDFQP